MKIIDVVLSSKKNQIRYIGKRIKRDAQGEPILEHGRAVTEDVTSLNTKPSLCLRFLVEEQTKDGPISEWVSEAELANRVGKKKYRNMVRDFTSSDKGRTLLRKAVEGLDD